MLIYSGLEVPGDDSSVGVDVSRRYALSTQLYMHKVIIFKAIMVL